MARLFQVEGKTSSLRVTSLVSCNGGTIAESVLSALVKPKSGKNAVSLSL